MEAKFTKGEWVFDGEGVLSNEKPVCIFGDDWITFDNKRANAHLIAAAPEMYEALEMIKNEWNLECSDMDFIELLLAKARGEHE